MLNRVRTYAHKHARRHFLLCDAHTPTGGYVERRQAPASTSTRFPCGSPRSRTTRIRGSPGRLCGCHLLEESRRRHARAAGRASICPTWSSSTTSAASNPGKPSKSPFIWGWDEITWFALMPEAERNDWLRYAWKWVQETDPNGHLQMPGSRVMTPGKPDAPALVLGQHAQRRLPPRVQHRSDDQGTLGDEMTAVVADSPGGSLPRMARRNAAFSRKNLDETRYLYPKKDDQMNDTVRLGLAALLIVVTLGNPTIARAEGGFTPFDGEKSAWHGFDRYDFVMDEDTLAITPFKAPADEGFGVRDPVQGQRRCIVVVPKQPAPGNPWSWRGCYWDHQPQTEVELLKRRLPRRLHLGQRRAEAGQGVGCLVRLPHGEARSVQEAGLHRHEPRRRIRLHVGHDPSRQGLLHLRRQSGRQSGELS